MFLAQSLLAASVKRLERQAPVQPVQDDCDDDDDDVISMTSRNARRRPVMHRDRPDSVYVGGPYAGAMTSYVRTALPPQDAVDRPLFVRKGEPSWESPSACGPWLANDVTDRRRKCFPTPIDRQASMMKVDRSRPPQPLFRPLDHPYHPDRTTSGLGSFRPHHPGYRGQYLGPPGQYLNGVWWSGEARQPRHRRVLPPVPSELRLRDNLTTARAGAAAFQPIPIYGYSNRYDSDADNDSISI